MANHNEGEGDPTSVVAAGRTVEEAVKRALLQLNATLDEVDIKILESGGPRLLRVGAAKEARVRVSLRDRPYSEEAGEDDDLEDDDDAEESDEADDAEGGDANSVPVATEPSHEPRREVEGGEDAGERPRGDLLESGGELQDVAEEVIDGLLDRMGFDADLELVEEAPLTYNVVGDERAMQQLVGSRGDTLRAFGYLVNLMSGRRLGRPCRVTIDVNGFRQRQNDRLAELARSLADEVRETKKPVTLEAMPANERRLIHVALAEDADVRTYSIGQGDDRRVVISPKA